jgi:osmoprotectant transport system substrate-binding protein
MSSSDSSASSSDTIVVGSADFSESQLLATIYSHALSNAGVTVKEKLNIGSREIYMEALEDGSIDLLPEYTGYLLTELNPDAKTTDDATILEELKTALPDGLIVLDESQAQNTDVLAVTADLAEKYSLTKISDLVPIAQNLTLAGPAEWKSRYVGVPGLEEVYGLKFGKFQVFDAGGPLTLSALLNGQADVGDMFSSDPAIAENNLVALKDDKGLFLPANVVPLIRESKATDTVTATLNSISAALTQDDLMTMNGKVSDGEDIGTIADEWLKDKGI